VAKNKGGRPPTPEAIVIEQQELYLSLLRLGKTELEINGADGAPCWDIRWRWLADRAFSARRLEASAKVLNSNSLMPRPARRDLPESPGRSCFAPACGNY